MGLGGSFLHASPQNSSQLWHAENASELISGKESSREQVPDRAMAVSKIMEQQWELAGVFCLMSDSEASRDFWAC